MLIREHFEKANCVAGVITNLLLLYCIRQHTRLSLGAYKQLLTIFASFDLFLTTLHGLTEPKILIINSVFGVVSASADESRMLPCFYCACFSVPFSLMTIHFLYRYWTVSRPHLIPLFSSPLFIALLVAVTTGEFIAWFLLCFYGLAAQDHESAVEILRAEFESRYGRNCTEGWLVMDRRDGADLSVLFPTFIAFDIIIAVSLLAAVTLASLTLKGIVRVWKLSRQKANLQLRLFIAMSAQTLVPCIFVYVPYFCCISFAYLRLPVSLMADLCFFLTSCFPAWDAVVIIVLMTDYRQALMGMVKRLKPPTLSTVSQTSFAMTPK